jgi:DNA-binding Lrp family transcriptional regulator
MEDQVVAELRKLKQLQEANMTYGPYDLVIKVNFRTMEEFDEFLFEKFRRINGIVETSSIIAAKQVI